MPSIYLHNYFSKDIYLKLKKDKIIVPKNPIYFYIFSQSFDYLFYYNFMKLKKGAKIRDFGYYAHTHKVCSYFANIITYMKKNKLYDDENIGYLYGSLSHYVLDSTFHPYIHYYSGRFTSLDKKHTKKYMGNHAINEIMLDAIYYYKNNTKKYYKYKLYKDMFPNLSFSKKLHDNMDNAYLSTFKKENMSEIYIDAFNQCKYAYKYLMYDRFNIKKSLYKFFDFLTPFKNFKAYTYSHHVNKINYDILNINHKKWLHPVTGDEHTESLEDLYNVASKKLINYIKICNDYFNDLCDIEKVKKTIKNISYSSGLDCEIRPTFQYFRDQKN